MATLWEKSPRSWVRPNGLEVSKMRIPLGVIAMIYESRPNVTVDAAALCLKAGNATILRGGSEAFHSNTILARMIQEALEEEGLARETVAGAAGHRPGSGHPSAQAGGIHRPGHPPGRGGPYPLRGQHLHHSGAQTLQGGVVSCLH